MLDALRRLKQRILNPLGFARRAKLQQLGVAVRLQGRRFRQIGTWFYGSREFTNFSYDLEPLNYAYLASLIAVVTGRPFEGVKEYFEELDRDEDLRDHLRHLARSGAVPGLDQEPRYARRIAWYAIARALKPAIVVETGVDKGLGTCVLACALMRNAREGRPGKVYGTDLNPHAGYLLQGKYREYGEILYGDSIESLQRLGGPIDLFINDSDHSADYESREYETIREKLSPKAVIIGDNAHCTDRLLRFARAAGWKFLFLSEVPRDHWYPGGGLGVAFR